MSLFSLKFFKSAQTILLPTPLAAPALVKPSGSPSKPAPALRVLRVRDPHGSGASSCQGGRLVISGRMADVCAELDRMVKAQSQRQGVTPAAQFH